MTNNTIVVVNLSSKCFLVYSSGTIQEMKSGDVHCSHALQRKKTSVQDKTEQRLGAQKEVMWGNTDERLQKFKMFYYIWHLSIVKEQLVFNVFEFFVHLSNTVFLIMQ